MNATAHQPWLADIHDLRRTKKTWQEGLYLEFKKSEKKLSASLWESYSAFANTEGGIILLGVKDNGTILGVENAPQQLQNILNTLNDSRKVSSNLSASAGMVEMLEMEGKTIIAIRVSNASAHEKPVYLNNDTTQAYFRQHEGDFLCRPDMLQQMLRDKTRHSKTDEPLYQTSWSCIDMASWQGYRNRVRNFTPEHPWVALDDKDALERLGGYFRETDTGREGLTLAGLLMFGTLEAIEKHYPQYQVNYYEYNDVAPRDSGRRWDDRIYADGSWHANLYQFFFRVLPRLTESLKRPFRLNPDLSAQGETTAHKAVREAFANAIVHADYEGDGGIILRRYPELLELINPGTLLVSKERMFRGGISVCRNLSLQKMFQRMGLVEKTGSGVDTILKGWMEQCLMPPQVHEDFQPAQVTWVLPFAGIIPLRDVDKLKQLVGAKRYESLPPFKRLILLVIYAKKQAGHPEIRELLPMLHPADLTRWLSELADAGCLVSEGRTRAKVYHLPLGAQEGDDGQMSQLDAQMSQLSDQMSHSDGQMSQFSENVLKVRKTRKIKTEITEAAILELSRGQWIIITDMAHILQREKRTLQRILSPMVSHGLLEVRFPEELNHPQQAYRTLRHPLPPEP